MVNINIAGDVSTLVAGLTGFIMSFRKCHWYHGEWRWRHINLNNHEIFFTILCMLIIKSIASLLIQYYLKYNSRIKEWISALILYLRLWWQRRIINAMHK